ncbi:AAA family ATPase [Chloroflexi bacterium TSY]|nr:AAA family ATPase [Chloroflexi bacterium TSY]
MPTDNSYYVDKTRFLPLIEEAPYYLFFIRPRRFGKTLNNQSTLLSGKGLSDKGQTERGGKKNPP